MTTSPSLFSCLSEHCLAVLHQLHDAGARPDRNAGPQHAVEQTRGDGLSAGERDVVRDAQREKAAEAGDAIKDKFNDAAAKAEKAADDLMK